MSERSAVLTAIFTLGWALMLVGMMLPSALPFLAQFRRSLGQRPDRDRLSTLLMLGYYTPWILFGISAFVGDWGLHRLVDATPWLAANTWVIATTMILLVGAYQFTSF